PAPESLWSRAPRASCAVWRPHLGTTRSSCRLTSAPSRAPRPRRPWPSTPSPGASTCWSITPAPCCARTATPLPWRSWTYSGASTCAPRSSLPRRLCAGRVTAHHRFMLDHLLRHIAFLDDAIATYDRHIETLTAADADPPARPDTIPGVARPTAAATAAAP